MYFSKKFGGRTPLGKIFSPIFFPDIDLKICVSHAPDPGKISKKILGAGPPWAPGLSLKGGKMTFFEFSHASTGHSFQAIDTKFFRRIALLLE